MKNLWMETQALSWRWFVHSKRRPMVLVAGLVQPFIWLLLFSAVFKNSPMANLNGATSYLAFITPGALVFTAFTGALNGGVPILFDRELGFLDRILVAPLASRFSIIWATGFHIFVMTLLQCAVIMVLTAIMGVRFHGGLQGVLVVLLTLGLITMLFTTLSLLLSFMLRYHFELLSIIMIISLPLVFISTAFAPVEFMPSWLKALVALNPITHAVEPLRTVFFNGDWTWTAAVFKSPVYDFCVLGSMIALVIGNVLVAVAARAVIVKKLN